MVFDGVLSLAQIGSAQKLPMCAADIGSLDGRIYPPSRASDYLPIAEILLQVAVVGEQKAGATDLGQRQYMLIVRSADPCGASILLGGSVDFTVVYAASLALLSKPAPTRR